MYIAECKYCDNIIEVDLNKQINKSITCPSCGAKISFGSIRKVKSKEEIQNEKNANKNLIISYLFILLFFVFVMLFILFVFGLIFLEPIIQGIFF